MISRIRTMDISRTSRYAKGVSLIKLNKNEILIDIKKISSGEKIWNHA